MAAISTSKATERLTRKLQRAGVNQWVAISSGDSWGKYLRFEVGGKCVGGCGWSLKEAEEIVDQKIYEHQTMQSHINVLDEEGTEIQKDMDELYRKIDAVS